MKKEDVLREYFGYSTFRHGQEELIDNILMGRDALAIMPTGAGKSLCFQVPALMMDGITLVISPLISLMKDQVRALISSGVPAAYINSSLTYTQSVKALENAKNGKYKIICVAPERLDVDIFLDFAHQVNISMVAVDESHCVSQWGQKFRPSYLKIVEFIENLPKRPIVTAFTATATDKVRDDIVRILKLQNPYMVTTGFNRENLYFEVKKPGDKMAEILNYLKKHPNQNGIIYCGTRKNVEKVCEDLVESGYGATRYHAGLDENERGKNQDDFLYDRANIMVATNAFGMGIDKSNVNFVIHYNMPKNIEDYYQEAGRAGRDGNSAQCILLFSPQDVVLNHFFIDNGNENDDLDPETAEKIKELDRIRLEQMTFYCHTTQCLRGYILGYFGEYSTKDCDNCGNCNGDFEKADITDETLKILSCVYRLNDRFGMTVIMDVLKGSGNERIIRLGLDKQTTYGMLRDYTQGRIREIINYLILNGYLSTTKGKFPTIKLENKGIEFLKNRTTIVMKSKKGTAEAKKTSKKSSYFLSHEDEELLAKLKNLRKEIARVKGVPAFVIFSDATLVDMCAQKPQTSQEMLNVSGVGQFKLEQFGEKFLTLLKEN